MNNKRVFDLLLCFFALIILAPIIAIIFLLIKFTSKGPALYWSDRIGQEGVVFKMPKFRSMQVGTPTLATHLLQKPQQYLTPVGAFLRNSSLDELPQLWSITKGDMSFVGPRPALYNQYDLTTLRRHYGVDILLPGLTGWAQINGRDDLPTPQKVEYDVYYLKHRSLWFDLKIIVMTFIKVLRKEGIQH